MHDGKTTPSRQGAVSRGRGGGRAGHSGTMAHSSVQPVDALISLVGNAVTCLVLIHTDEVIGET